MNAATISHRSSLRGIRKCAKCGKYNGTRAFSCRNQECPLSKIETTSKTERNKAAASMLAVQLQTKGESCLYSVPNREKNPVRRSFVQITDRTISSDEDGCIISRNAICFVDTCKYDSHDLNISCKHIKWALDGNLQAKVTQIQYDVWKSIRFPTDDGIRNKIWKKYQTSIDGTPMVQQINAQTFAVACDVSTQFPAGRLHVCVNGTNQSRTKQTPAGFHCSCRKEQNGNSNTDSCASGNDSCDHVCLVVAAIKSCSRLTMEFKREFAEYSNYFQEQETIKLIGKFV